MGRRFVWEAAYGPDAWSMLAAMAARTSRVRLGTMLTPLPWRRPWKVASQVATLDQLSGGRAILAVGVGALDTDLPETGEVTGLCDRADRMDEGIDLIRVLWAGGRSYHGTYYDYETGRLDLGAACEAGPGPHPDLGGRRLGSAAVDAAGAALRRHHPAIAGNDSEPRPEDAAAVRGWLTGQSLPGSFDLIADGETPADDPQAAAATAAQWASAGCTWWLETRWEARDTMGERIAAGPPRSA